jgi:DNA-binding Lrp family transcriptional regulator
LEIYLSCLKDHAEITKFDKVRKAILYHLLERYKSPYSLSRSATHKHVFRREDGTEVSFSELNRTSDTVKAAMKKLERDGLITKVKQKEKEKNLSGWDLFDINKYKPNHYRVTEYGIFCILLYEFDYPYRLLSKCWNSTVVQTLVAPYFSKDTIEHPTPGVHFTVVKFINRSCRITNDILKEIRASEQKGIEISKYVKKLERDLLLHAKLFVLRFVLSYITRDEQQVDSDDLFNNSLTMQLLMGDSQFRRFLISTLGDLSRIYQNIQMFDKAQERETDCTRTANAT